MVEPSRRLRASLSTLWRELADGAGADAGWVLNSGDRGLLRSLENLSAKDASARPANGGASIAAHVDHLRYGLSLLNRWSRGDDPFKDADYSASWQRSNVSDDEWSALRERLRAEVRSWDEALQRPGELSDDKLTGAIASIVHLAYHVGAIRQIDRAARGPSARD